VGLSGGDPRPLLRAQVPGAGRRIPQLHFPEPARRQARQPAAIGEQFASNIGWRLPADVDPDGKLQAQVQADFDLGMQISWSTSL